MYFLPRAPNKLYARAAHVSSSYRYGITVCFFGVTIASWFFLIYRPVEASLGAYNVLNGTLRGECTSGMACQKSVDDLTQDIDQLRTMLDSDSTNIGSCIDWASSVISCAQQGGLTIKTYTVGQDAKKEWYCITRAQFEVTGTYEQLLNFLRDLQKINPPIGCKQWSLTHAYAGNYSMACTLYLLQQTQKA